MSAQYIMSKKFVEGMPLYRQEAICPARGSPLRQTLANCVLFAADRRMCCIIPNRRDPESIRRHSWRDSGDTCMWTDMPGATICRMSRSSGAGRMREGQAAPLVRDTAGNRPKSQMKMR